MDKSEVRAYTMAREFGSMAIDARRAQNLALAKTSTYVVMWTNADGQRREDFFISIDGELAKKGYGEISEYHLCENCADSAGTFVRTLLHNGCADVEVRRI